MCVKSSGGMRSRVAREHAMPNARYTVKVAPVGIDEVNRLILVLQRAKLGQSRRGLLEPFTLNAISVVGVGTVHKRITAPAPTLNTP